MGMGSILDDIVEEKLLNLHTAFFARVTSVTSPDLCSVQPLNKIKAYGKTAKTQGVITNVPVLNHVRHYSLVKQAEDTGSDTGHLKVSTIKNGDIVLCVCGDRDISAACDGKSTTPPTGHHMIKDAVVVGLIGRWAHE